MPIGVEDLRRIDLLAGLDDAALSRLAAAATERHLEPGELLVPAGAPAEHFLVLLEGEVIAIDPRYEGATAGRNIAPTYMGALAILTETPWVVENRAVTRSRVALVDRSAFLDLVHAERSVERTVARAIVDTMRRIEGAFSRHEKLASLGTLSAGLAHELNNPAAAARRTVDALVEALDTVQGALGAFVESGVERDAAEQLVALQREALQRAAAAPALDVLDASEREDEV
ncbi:MAG TPA: cyclic nucleotide-binding domain-containing protein, partial [Solirubrobacteraceae bacterium]